MSDPVDGIDEVPCPYCGYRQESDLWDTNAYEAVDADVDFTCGMCDRTFQLSCTVRHYFTATPTPADRREPPQGGNK